MPGGEGRAVDDGPQSVTYQLLVKYSRVLLPSSLSENVTEALIAAVGISTFAGVGTSTR